MLVSFRTTSLLALWTLGFGCATPPTEGIETSQHSLSSYKQRMTHACLDELGKTLLTDTPAMTNEAARGLSARMGDRELGRVRLNVRRAFCSTDGYDEFEVPGCIWEDVHHDMDFWSDVEDERNYRAAKVHLDLVDGRPRLRLESTTSPTFFFRPQWHVEGAFDDLTVELTKSSTYGPSPVDFDDLRVLRDDDWRFRLPARLTNDALTLEKTIGPQVVWNTVSCWRAVGVVPLPR